MAERVIGTVKEQCTHRYRFESIPHATRVIGDWISVYNHHSPHQALGPCARLPRHSDERLNLTRFSWVITVELDPVYCDVAVRRWEMATDRVSKPSL